jgi:phytoene dehydrogenase-like protein
MPEHDVIVVGAGLAGLSCALRLRQWGREPLVLEASDDVGGRVRTDVVDGFLLDRGFQILLTAYPEARRVLDYDALALRSFNPGVLVWRGSRFQRLSDPFRMPHQALASVLSAVGTWQDKLRLAGLRLDLVRSPAARLRSRPDVPTIDELRRRGFSQRMIKSFFAPFLGSVFFDPDLSTSSRLFALVMRNFFQGATAVPAAGMGAIPRQLASRLGSGSIRLRTHVAEVGDGWVRLDDGQELGAHAVVVATEGPVAAGLVAEIGPVTSRGGATVYFAAPRPPMREATLMLEGTQSGPATLAVVLSNVAESYAPACRALIATAVIGDPPASDDALEVALRAQLRRWFGACVDEWRRLAVYRIPHAVPAQVTGAPLARPVALAGRLFVCGDHRDTPSIQGALVSGRRAAGAIARARP